MFGIAYGVGVFPFIVPGPCSGRVAIFEGLSRVLQGFTGFNRVLQVIIPRLVFSVVSLEYDSATNATLG